MFKVLSEEENFSKYGSILTDLKHFFTIDIIFFRAFSEMVLTFKSGNFEADEVEEFKEDLLLTYPILQDNHADFFKVIDSICDLKPKQYEFFRGDVLEYIIAEFAETIIATNQPLLVLYQVQLMKDNKLIGEQGTSTERTLDVCFTESETFLDDDPIAVELHECKINLSNFIPFDKNNVRKSARKNLNKIYYMKEIANHLSQNPLFRIGFSTLNKNKAREIHALSQLECESFFVFSCKEIENAIQMYAR